MLAERAAELRHFKSRADALSVLGKKAQSSGLFERQATTAYSALKKDLLARKKLQKRLKGHQAETWFEALFQAAMSKAYSAMRSPTHTRPANARWTNSVADLQYEIDYHLKKFEKALTRE